MIERATMADVEASKVRREQIYAQKLAPHKRLATFPRISKRNFAAGIADRLSSDFLGTTSSVNTLLTNQLCLMRKRSRSLARNEPYFIRYLRLLAKNVVGPYGIQLKMRAVRGYDPKTGKPDYDLADNATIERAFADWSLPQNCTASGRLSRAQVEQLAEKTQAIDGEVFIELLAPFDGNDYRFAWNFIEADRVDETYNETLPNGNTVIMGVEVDQWCKPVAYHIYDRNPNETIIGVNQKSERKRIPAERIIHKFEQVFPGQVRGIPEMYAAILRLNHLGQYEEAEVIASRIAAGKMGFVVDAPGTEFSGDDELDDGSVVIDAEPGTFTRLRNGAEVKTFDPQHPNSSFEAFVRAMLRSVACVADMSYHSLTGDLSAVNYSSARIGLLDERDTYMTRQQSLIDHLLARSFPVWLKFALMTGKIPLPSTRFDKFNAASWRPRRWTWVDPQKEANAAITAIEAGLKSRQQVIEESDSLADPEEIWSELEYEKERLKFMAEPKPEPMHGQKPDAEDDTED